MLTKWFKDEKNKDLIIIVALIILNILPRLIYLFSGGLFVDGDEAILGAVIRDFLNNHQLPLFLNGQSYGLVMPEVLIGGAVSLIFGANIFSLKITILLFWLANIVVLYYIGKKIFRRRRFAFLAVLLISFIPVWYEWATRARFGYVSSLLISDIVILLALSKRNITRTAGISLSLLVIYYSQPLYLVVTIPFLAYYFLKDFRFKDTALFAAVSLVLLAASKFLLTYIGSSFQLQSRLGINDLARNIKNIFRYYSVAYSGRFFDDVQLKGHYLTTISGYIFIGMLLVVAVYDLYLVFQKKMGKINALFFSATALYIIFMLFYNGADYNYRYLLPFFVPSVFSIILTVERIPGPKLGKYVYGFLVVYAVFSLVGGILAYSYVYPQLDDGYTEVERIESLGKLLKVNNIRCVYALDWLISQHIEYFIPEVKVRHQTIDTRRPQDSNLVDSSQKTDGCALVGFKYQLPLFAYLYKLEDIYIVNNRYVMHLRPSREDLLKLNFQLTN